MTPKVFRITELLCHCGKGVAIPRGCLPSPVNRAEKNQNT